MCYKREDVFFCHATHLFSLLSIVVLVQVGGQQAREWNTRPPPCGAVASGGTAAGPDQQAEWHSGAGLLCLRASPVPNGVFPLLNSFANVSIQAEAWDQAAV